MRKIKGDIFSEILNGDREIYVLIPVKEMSMAGFIEAVKNGMEFAADGVEDVPTEHENQEDLPTEHENQEDDNAAEESKNQSALKEKIEEVHAKEKEEREKNQQKKAVQKSEKQTRRKPLGIIAFDVADMELKGMNIEEIAQELGVPLQQMMNWRHNHRTKVNEEKERIKEIKELAKQCIK